MTNCNICENKNLIEVKFNNIFLRTDSSVKNLHNYKSFICQNCGVLNQHPQMSEAELSKHYNSNYRNSGYEMKIEDKTIDFPLKFSQTGLSFQRFFHFSKIISENKIDMNDKTVLDYGSYQGAFLYGCKKLYNCKTIGYDYNINGLNFSKNFLNIDEIYETKNINEDRFKEKIDLCSLIHTFEHINNPNKFLSHVYTNILNEGDLLYIEVPDIETCHFADPTHCFVYSIDSLKYVLNKNNFEIVLIKKNKFYGPKDSSTPRRFFQHNIHCLAKKVEKVDFISTPMQGYKIYKKTKQMHKNIFTKYIIKKLFKIFYEIFDFTNMLISKIISVFSGKLSVEIYEKINRSKTFFVKLLKKFI